MSKDLDLMSLSDLFILLRYILMIKGILAMAAQRVSAFDFQIPSLCTYASKIWHATDTHSQMHFRLLVYSRSPCRAFHWIHFEANTDGLSSCQPPTLPIFVAVARYVRLVSSRRH
ncbi:hypothetical protein OE88DRAFT_1323420 [Heliocybe sulcata]|uniref:Uncharacterized protein n=1 Tax=Heliocybe sulcata TaxID=5364 RepID=A0A5C3N5P3_9AGAM|nr:hypothetical protein OE88DRAFT_1323420 [Heliocybe sulcata]